jgi:hypothetical protein
MPRPSERTIDDIIQEVVARVVLQVSRAVGRSGGAGRRRARPRGREAVSRWVADARARRVPKFVVVQTGLDTKKAIVARYGASARFVLGEPAPRPKGKA